MLQFGESTLRLAVVARQAGRGVEAVNELWPLVARLEARAAEGFLERDVLILLSRARAELGVSLGYILPEERLAVAARWTGRAVRLAERVDQPDLLAHALRVHGNELRKIEHTAAAVARLRHAAQLTPSRNQAAVLMQLARAIGELGDPGTFDAAHADAQRAVPDRNDTLAANHLAIHEVRLRGLIRTGRA